jgi:hypothetical protein
MGKLGRCTEVWMKVFKTETKLNCTRKEISGFFEYGDETSDFITVGNIFYCMKGCQLRTN